MKILLIHNYWLERGGEDEAVNAEMKLLQNAGHKVVVYERFNKEITKFSFIRKWRFLMKGIVWSDKTYREIKTLVKQEKPDVAHIHNIFILISPAVYYALSDENIPVVQTLHNYRFFCPSGIFYRNGRVCEECRDADFIPAILHKCWRNSYILSYFLAKSLKVHFKNNTFKGKIDCYIALSEFSRNKFIERGFPKDKLFIKPNFLELNKQERNDIQNFSLFIGRLVDYKGVNTLINTFRGLGKYNLKIIGTGPLYEQLRKETTNIPNIELLGRLPCEDTFRYIRKCRFLLFPSECYENMPRVIIESFACGVPVVASNSGPVGELVEDGVTGLLFEPSNSKDFAQKIRLLTEDREFCLKLGMQAREVYEAKYTPEKNFQLLMDIYEKAIGMGASRN